MFHALTVNCMRAWDGFYHRRHRLEPVGPMLFVGQDLHCGAARRFADGTLLHQGDRVGVLHFNNARIAGLAAGSRHQAAWEFTRLLRSSLEALAEFSMSDAGAAICAYHGTTWMQPHGLKVGFTIESLPPGWRTRWLQWHFRLLRLCFAPASYRSRRAVPEPRLFWITRSELREHFLKVPS